MSNIQGVATLQSRSKYERFLFETGIYIFLIFT